MRGVTEEACFLMNVLAVTGGNMLFGAVVALMDMKVTEFEPKHKKSAMSRKANLSVHSFHFVLCRVASCFLVAGSLALCTLRRASGIAHVP